MLFPDIKTYFIELEADEDELYLIDLESTHNLGEFIQVVEEYHNIDDLEAATLILNKVCS